MLATLPESSTFAFLLLGALTAGFVTGFAGFGTGLVASGFWFHVLPAALVPPMVVMASVAAQLVGLVGVRPTIDWARTTPYLIGGALGVPLGVAALVLASPDFLRLSVGVFLVCYAFVQLGGITRLSVGGWGGQRADAAIGLGGGILGGFAGLSGPLPVIWLQLRGGPSVEQRAVYQPFNLIVLAIAGAGMAAAGQIGAGALQAMLLAAPVTALGAWLGAHLYRRSSEAVVRRVVLALLLLSGAALVFQGLQ